MRTQFKDQLVIDAHTMLTTMLARDARAYETQEYKDIERAIYMLEATKTTKVIVLDEDDDLTISYWGGL